MKLSDYVSVITLAIAGTILAYFLTNSILGDPAAKTTTFEYLEPVSGELVQPSSDVFNAAAINPTVEIYIGDCVDDSKDGYLSEDELKKCGRAAPESSVGGDTSTDSTLDAENEAINRAEGYAQGTTAEQRQNVQSQIDAYAEQQRTNSTSASSASSSAASGTQSVNSGTSSSTNPSTQTTTGN